MEKLPFYLSSFNCSSLTEINQAFYKTAPDQAYLVQVADKERSLSYEWATFATRKRPAPVAGLLAAGQRIRSAAATFLGRIGSFRLI